MRPCDHAQNRAWLSVGWGRRGRRAESKLRRPYPKWLRIGVTCTQESRKAEGSLPPNHRTCMYIPPLPLQSGVTASPEGPSPLINKTELIMCSELEGHREFSRERFPRDLLIFSLSPHHVHSIPSLPSLAQEAGPMNSSNVPPCPVASGWIQAIGTPDSRGGLEERQSRPLVPPTPSPPACLAFSPNRPQQTHLPQASCLPHSFRWNGANRCPLRLPLGASPS